MAFSSVRNVVVWFIVIWSFNNKQCDAKKCYHANVCNDVVRHWEGKQAYDEKGENFEAVGNIGSETLTQTDDIHCNSTTAQLTVLHIV